MRKREENMCQRTLALALVLAAMLMAVTPGLPSHASQPKAKNPNIIFIFADDWGYGDLSCHGSKTFKTPNLDRLARGGIDFQNFLVCNPVCSPSRTAVLTGQFPARNCIHQHFATVEHHEKTGMPDGLNLNQELKKAELYDLDVDWAETHDLSDEQPEVVARLTAQVLGWKANLPDKPPPECFSKLRE